MLFNLAADGRPIIRKASAHGLGHMLAPYGEDDPPRCIPAPSVPLSEIGVARWHYDLWFQIIRSVQEGHPMRVDLDYHPALDRPAASRYGATSPDLLRWFKTFNEGRPYRDQVKPFNFLLSFQAKPSFEGGDLIVLGRPKRGRRPKQHTPKPIAPFSKDLDEASRNAFDRETGRQIDPRDLKTYREALRFYHLSPNRNFSAAITSLTVGPSGGTFAAKRSNASARRRIDGRSSFSSASMKARKLIMGPSLAKSLWTNACGDHAPKSGNGKRRSGMDCRGRR